MIDVIEYDRWKQLEVVWSRRALRPSYWREGQRTFIVDSTPIRVYTDNQVPLPNTYHFYYHPRFGVVKALNEDGTKIDKSPLCEKLDKEIFG